MKSSNANDAPAYDAPRNIVQALSKLQTRFMNIAHLILAHSEPRQLERLVARLQHKTAYFFIHIDKKTNIAPFEFLTENERVFLITNREKVSWGAYSIVQATLNGFEAIIKSGIPIDVVNLLSGSDYPLKNSDKINQFFDEHKGQNFMHFELVYEEWQEAITRLTAYHLTNFSFPGKYFVQKWMNRMLPKRIMPENLIPVGRSQWLSITTEAVKYILDYLDEHPGIVRFFKLSWAPDEIIFQTILYNSNFRSSLINNNLRYIDWSPGKASPRILTLDDFPKLMQSNALFARKFDLAKHPEVLNQLDSILQNSLH